MNRFERAAKSQRRVVVTGIGILCPVGLDRESSWKSLLSGQSGISTISRFDASSFDCKIAGEVKQFNPDPFVPKKDQKKMDLFIQFALAATDEAVRHSGLTPEQIRGPKTGVMIGAGIGGLPGIEDTHETYRTRGPSRISPFFIPSVITNLASGQVAIKYGAQGVNFCVTSACASGAHSIGEATRYIRDGLANIMIAGGTESTVSALAVGGFSAMKALSTRNDQPTMASRPFDKDRDGFVLGEGAAVMILEDMEFAEKRGAVAICEVTGYGMSCDANHMTNPAPGGAGAAQAMRTALMDAGLSPQQIDYVNAHGTSTPVGDELETLAIKSVFETHSKKIAVSSTKSMTGHLLGAAGSLESAICALAIRDQKIPPTINLDNPSEACDLDYVAFKCRDAKLTNVLNNSFGFGGTNASLIFSRI